MQIKNMKIFIYILFFVQTTLWCFEKYVLPCDSLLLELSLKIALNQVVTIENRENNGEVRKYLKSVGINSKAPYCAAGQYYCFAKACQLLNTCIIPIPRTASSNDIFSFAIKNGKRKNYEATRHCLIVWRFPKSWKGHIERVFEVGKNGWVKTVAFNVKEIIGNNLYEGIFIKRRNIYEPLGRLKIRGIVGFKAIENNYKSQVIK